MSLLSDKKTILHCIPMPVRDTWVNKKIRPQYHIEEIIAIIKSWISDYHVEKLVMERVSAIPFQSSQTAFSLGGATFMFETICAMLKIHVEVVEPRAWQKKIFGDLGISYDKKTTKQASIQAAKILFPDFDFRKSEKCRVASDGKTDSVLIGFYSFNK